MAKYDERHGGAYDRGSADAYYGRPIAPHYYEGDTGMSKRVDEAEMSAIRIAAYLTGYREQIESGEFKEYD